MFCNELTTAPNACNVAPLWPKSISSRCSAGQHDPNRSIDPTTSDMDTQLALLPVWCASCDSFVMLFTSTLLTRLWCVVELFVWMHVGDAQAIFVCVSDWHNGRASRNGVQTAAGSIAQPSSQADAQPCVALTAMLASFDVRNADCFGRDTRARLFSVIEVGCGSLDAFSALASSVLMTRLDAQDALVEIRAQSPAQTPACHLSNCYSFEQRVVLPAASQVENGTLGRPADEQLVVTNEVSDSLSAGSGRRASSGVLRTSRIVSSPWRAQRITPHAGRRPGPSALVTPTSQSSGTTTEELPRAALRTACPRSQYDVS